MTNEEQFYSELEEKVKKSLPEADLTRLRAAFEYALSKHEGQKRLDGSPFITHPLNVAIIIAEMGMDSDCVVAALLHDVVEDTEATHEEISRKFSESVAQLVEGVTKLNRVRFNSREEEQMENLRKMLMAMAKDIRVILIKLSDRLHNMRTLQFQPKGKQKRVALETMEVYAPIAHRLGMQKIKWELEDISLLYLDPVGYEDISKSIEKISRENKGFIDKICAEITERMKNAGIESTVYGRVKHIYSLYRKMYTRNVNLGEIYDYFAFRVIVDTIPECYNVLGQLHDQFKPVPGRFKDYIGTPKPNLYQSLHTVVIGTDGIPFEVQIRTWEMHNTAEYGIAAHWKYKRGMGSGKDMGEGKFEWVRRLLESQEEMDAGEFVSSLKTDLFADEVFVFTPRGDLINLPSGATPIDFAYSIHSAVGNRMVGAKVNGRMVPYNYVLQNGDIAEVVTSNGGHGPSRDWMNIAKSNEARTKIRQWFKKERREENIVNGRSSFDSELKRVGITMDDISDEEIMSTSLKKLTYGTFEDMLASIGYGGLTSLRAVNRFREEYLRHNRASGTKENPLHIQDKPHKVTESGVEVQGLDNCLTKYSRCCLPVPGDKIVGFITRGFGVSVHRKDCINVINSMGKEEDRGRWVAVNWANDENQMFETKLIILATDKDGLLLDIATALSSLKVRITSINARALGDGNAEVAIALTVTGLEQLKQVMNRIFRASGVKEVRRGNS